MAHIEKEWQIAAEAPRDFVKKYQKLNPLVVRLLHNRNINKKEEIDKFFNPEYDRDLFNPLYCLFHVSK